MNNDIVPRQTVSQLAATYAAAMQTLQGACAAIVDAERALQAAFECASEHSTCSRFSLASAIRHHCDDFAAWPRIELKLRQVAWTTLVERINLKRLVSLKRAEEIERQLSDQNAANLPEITEANVLAMLENNSKSASAYLEEAAREVFKYLMPGQWSQQYKTNAANRARLGSKVIKCVLENRYGGGFSVSYHHQNEIRAIDNVFHLLAGVPLSQSHHGDLYDAIYQSKDGTGQTEFFKFKCFANRNLHLEFRRMDLVDKLNVLAGNPSAIACS